MEHCGSGTPQLANKFKMADRRMKMQETQIPLHVAQHCSVLVFPLQQFRSLRQLWSRALFFTPRCTAHSWILYQELGARGGGGVISLAPASPHGFYRWWTWVFNPTLLFTSQRRSIQSTAFKLPYTEIHGYRTRATSTLSVYWNCLNYWWTNSHQLFILPLSHRRNIHDIKASPVFRCQVPRLE